MPKSFHKKSLKPNLQKEKNRSLKGNQKIAIKAFLRDFPGQESFFLDSESYCQKIPYL